MTPLGLVEDLELERFAVVELERKAGELWAAGSLTARGASLKLRAEAVEARAHVAELEAALGRRRPLGSPGRRLHEVVEPAGVLGRPLAFSADLRRKCAQRARLGRVPSVAVQKSRAGPMATRRSALPARK